MKGIGQMKNVLVVVGLLAALLSSACGRATGGETPAATVPQETLEQLEVESTEVAIEPTETSSPPTPVEPTVTPGTTESVAATEVPQEPTAEPATPSPTATVPPSPTPTATSTAAGAYVSAGQPVELTRLEDTDPGPPFSILVSTIRILDDGYYKLTGRIRNDSAQVYRGVGVIVTFYTADEPQNMHRLGRVRGACDLLAPGADCPFSATLQPRNYVSYQLHPEGTPVEYSRPAPLVLTNVTVEADWIGYVRIRGTATNRNEFLLDDAFVSAVLLDASGQIVSVGWTIVPGELEPGASASFDLSIEQVAYTSYELQAQGVRD
jgi:hypothetical protein